MTNFRIHTRRSIRLKGYDYSQEGLYFITICVQDKICRFGHIENGKMIYNQYGTIALGLIAQHKPKFKEKIINELIAISKDKFETNECENIATGKVLEAIKPFVSDIKNNKSVITFIENATKAERNSTKKRAEQLLKKIEK